MAQLWVVPEELDESSASPYAYEACKSASFLVWAFSGRKYHGTRTVTERYECPCRSGLGVSFNVYPRLDGAGIVENRLDSRINGCDCSGTVAGRHKRLRLRGTPVRSVSKVERDGEVIDPSQYKIVNGSILQLNGPKDVCGLEVTYTYGVPVPTAGRRAARALAIELVRGWEDASQCALPERVTSVQRQGVSISVLDPQDFLDDGRTGIYAVDLFLRAVNPDKARKPARVFSPDLPKAYRATAGATSKPASPLDWNITPGSVATWSIDITDHGAELFLEDEWSPFGQIRSAGSVIIHEFPANRFTLTGNTLTITLTGAETNSINTSPAFWDLYALSDLDNSSIVHVLESTIHRARTV